MSKRVLALVTALVMALMMSLGGMVFAKQAQTFGKGQTTTYQGNSTNSPVVSCHHGSPGSNGSGC